MEETLRKQLLVLCHRHGEVSKLTPGVLGKASLRDHTFFRRIEQGENFTVKTFDKVVQWFSDHWPSDANWPADIPRPEPFADNPAPRVPKISARLTTASAVPSRATADWSGAERQQLPDEAKVDRAEDGCR